MAYLLESTRYLLGLEDERRWAIQLQRVPVLTTLSEWL